MQEKYAKTDESITQAFKDLDALIAKVIFFFQYDFFCFKSFILFYY